MRETACQREETGELRAAGHTIAEMMSALRQAGTEQAIALEAIEELAARHELRVYAGAAENARRVGTALGATHALLSALLPHESKIVELLASPGKTT